MTKVAIKSDKITSLGGIFHVMDVFSKLGLNQIIDSSLGQRGSTSTAFQYSDIISSLFIAIYVVLIAWKILTRSLLSFHYPPNVHFLGQTLLVVV